MSILDSTQALLEQLRGEIGDDGSFGDLALEDQSTEAKKTRWIAKRQERRKSLREDSRGMANLLGLMLSMVILASVFVMVQTDVGPSVRETSDYEHATRLLGEFQKVTADQQVVAGTGIPQGTVLHVGGDYPDYVVLLHPPGPSGTLATTSDRQISLSNVVAVDPEAREFLSGRDLVLQTTGLSYTPGYAAYREAPTTVLENGVLYQKYSHTSEVVSAPSMVAGREISLITMTGTFSTAQTAPLLLYTEPLSTSMVPVVITDSGSPITLTIQTDLSEAMWREILAAELDPETSRVSPSTDDDNRYIADIEFTEGTTTNTLQVYLETGVTYNLYMSQLGVRTGKQVAFAQSEAPPTGYLTAVSDRRPVLVEQTATKLTVEVRDTYSNAQSGVKVEASIVDGDGNLDRIEDISNGKGQVSFQYTAPEITSHTSEVSEETVTVLVKISNTTGDQYAVSFEVQVQNTHN